jgi:hypothetical protein
MLAALVTHHEEEQLPQNPPEISNKYCKIFQNILKYYKEIV